MRELIEKLHQKHQLSISEYKALLEMDSETDAELLRKYAIDWQNKYYGNQVFVRGLIEISNYCKNDCYYCGIRKSNRNLSRYRLSESEILNCCQQGYALGYRTFVLQGGEDGFYNDEMLCHLLRKMKKQFSDCAVTLSLGERSKASYQALFDAGADRYLLRHESANAHHYALLHPQNLSFHNRIECLKNLKEIGYQVGCGFMVGSPFQTIQNLAEELKFVEQIKPDMCGIGPFIPHRETPFANHKSGTMEMTCRMISILRLIQPNLLIPSTTALGTIHPQGRERGIQSGANVVMPNLSPVGVRKKYELYENKICTGEEAAECRGCLERRMASVGYQIITDIGNPRKEIRNNGSL